MQKYITKYRIWWTNNIYFIFEIEFLIIYIYIMFIFLLYFFIFIIIGFVQMAPLTIALATGNNFYGIFFIMKKKMK